MSYTVSLKILGLACLTFLLFSCNRAEKKSSRVENLPYYSEASFTPHWFETGDVPSDFHQIPSFKLMNQEGKEVTEKDLDGRITVVDFFFTSCPGICPKMTDNMSLVQEAHLDTKEVLILSHSVTPTYDSVPILREYAELKGVVDSKWYLLTGDKATIYDLGRKSYFIEEDLGLEKDPEDFIHTENFVLIDQKRRIRGIYNGLNKTAIKQLIADIESLKTEGA